MPTLSSSLVKQDVASMRDVEEALARQVVYGGDLVTNLLELAQVPERALTKALAESHELLPAPSGALPTAPDATLRLVPGDLAARHGLYPLSEIDGVLIVAVSEPLAVEVEEDLGFLLGLRIEQRVAPLVRVRQALARDYGLPMDRRSERVIDRLEGHGAPASWLPPAEQTLLAHIPRAPSLPPLAYPPVLDFDAPAPAPAAALASAPPVVEERAEPTPDRAERFASVPASPVDPAPAAVPPPPAPPPPALAVAQVEVDESWSVPPPAVAAPADPPAPAVVAGVPSAAAAASDAPPPQPLATEAPERRRDVAPASLRRWVSGLKQAEKVRERRRGPYTAADAERDLAAASTRDDVLVSFFDYVSQYFEYCALFTVHGDVAEGRDAHGPGADRSIIGKVQIALDVHSAFASARDAGAPQVVRLRANALDAEIAGRLGRKAGRAVLLLPVVLRGRTVLLVYGDFGANDVVLEALGGVIAFAPLVGNALEALVVRRKLAARRALEGEGGLDLRSAEEREAALAAAPLLSPLPPRAIAQRSPAPPVDERRQLLVEAITGGMAFEPAFLDAPAAPRRSDFAASHVPVPPRPPAAPTQEAAAAPPVVVAAPAAVPPVAAAPPMQVVVLQPAAPAPKPIVLKAADPAARSKPPPKPPRAPSDPPDRRAPAPAAAVPPPVSVAPAQPRLASQAPTASKAPPKPIRKPTPFPGSRAVTPAPSDVASFVAPSTPSRAMTPMPTVSLVPRSERPTPASGTRRQDSEAPIPLTRRPALVLREIFEAEEAPRATITTRPPPPDPESLPPPTVATAQVAPAPPASRAPVFAPPRPLAASPRAEPAERPPTSATPSPRSTQRLELVPETVLDDDAPDVAIGTGTLEQDELIAMELEEQGGPPRSRSEAHAGVKPPARHSSAEMKLPSVIVDADGDVRALVEAHLAGDAAAADRLIELGDSAVVHLVSRFPGPITADPRHVERLPASECGPVLHLLVRLAEHATPFVVVRSADVNPQVRLWATRLLGELPSIEAARAIAKRLGDDDGEVRRAALAAARHVSIDDDCATALREHLLAVAGERAQRDHARHAAIEALADLREAHAVQRLTQLLSEPNGDIAKSAHWALTVIARQDFGRDAARWERWWQAEGARHRVEWLIEALAHDSPDVRRAASDELKQISKEYFGYYDDLPRKERVKAQQRYREWWEQKGRMRFTRRAD